MSKCDISRRIFLMGTAATLAGCVTRKIAPRPRVRNISPNEKLNVAAVGIGGMGHSDVSAFAEAGENIVALCDVDWDYAAKVFNEFPKAKRYKDFRVMLEKEKNIDAVIVATPDNLHAVVTIMALKMGKHVYCEKPLTHSVHEAYLVGKAAKEAGVATQMGNQGQASERTRRLYEYIWDGAIGKVREVHVWTDRPVGWWPQGVPRTLPMAPSQMYS